MNRLIQSKNFTTFIVSVAALVCIELLPQAHAVVPAPDGGYPGGNTAEGQNALLSLTSGTWNTAVGFASLKSNTIGNVNTAIGVNALSLNTTGVNNTANGGNALYSNTTGYQNTADGVYALFRNTTGIANTANGALALRDNTTASGNTAIGQAALLRNTTGMNNTAIGVLALWNNVTGSGNTAVGVGALQNPFGDGNTALGAGAGIDTTGSNNVYIGAGIRGFPDESNACYIASIFGQTSGGIPVLIGSDNKLGTATSSKRFKEQIKPMDRASEAVFSLKPVTFRYKKEIDPAGTSQFGLVAEEVEKVNPALVVRDKEGKPYSVRYEQVNAMLLNEFLKEHRKNEEQEATIARQQKQIEALTEGLQKVSAQLEVNKPAQRMVNNDH